MLNKRNFFQNLFDGHLLEVASGASIAFVLKVTGAGLSFGFSVLLARELGAEGMGVYSVVLAVTSAVVVFGKMGLDLALLRFTATKAAIGDWVAVKGAYQKGTLLALAASSMSALVLFVATPWLAETVFSKPELTGALRWMVLAIVPMVILNLNAEALRGLKYILRSQLVQGVCVPAFAVISLHLFVRSWGVIGAVWAYTIAALLAAVLGLWFWRSKTSRLRDVSARFDTRELLRSSSPLFWVEFMNLITNWTGTWALGVWGTKEDVGIFSAASRTAMIIAFFLAAVSSITAPKFGALYEQGDREVLGSLARNSAKLTALLGTPPTLLFVFFPAWVMGTFGSQFTEGAPALVILAAGQFVNVATGPVGYLLIMSGHESLFRNSVTFSAVLNAALSLMIVPWLGVLGAAVATSVSVAALNLTLVYMAWSRLRIWTIPFFHRA